MLQLGVVRCCCVVVASDATMREQCLCRQSPMNCATHWRSTPDNLEEREKWPGNAENPTQNRHIPAENVPVSVARDPNCRCVITATSMTAELHLRHLQALSFTTTGMATTCPRAGPTEEKLYHSTISPMIYGTRRHDLLHVASLNQEGLPAIVGNAARGAKIPAKPGAHMPLTL